MLNLNNITKNYLHQKKLLTPISNFSLTVNTGEFVALLGPSGCGKSTLLKIIASLEKFDSGEILLDGKKITKPSKKIGLVFQNYSLFPWLSVSENIAFALKLQKSANTKNLVDYYLNLIGLSKFAKFYPKQLSGGQQQRVAIARTLAANPDLLLMDEPFGALDSQTRQQMQNFLLDIWQKEKKTVIFVTHDAREALFLADKVYTLSGYPMTIKK